MQPDEAIRFVCGDHVARLAEDCVRHEPAAHADPAMNAPHGQLECRRPPSLRATRARAGRRYRRACHRDRTGTPCDRAAGPPCGATADIQTHLSTAAAIDEAVPRGSGDSITFRSANAYRCFSVRTYSVSSAIAGVARRAFAERRIFGHDFQLRRAAFEHSDRAVVERHEIHVAVRGHGRRIIAAGRGQPLLVQSVCRSSRRRR